MCTFAASQHCQLAEKEAGVPFVGEEKSSPHSLGRSYSLPGLRLLSSAWQSSPLRLLTIIRQNQYVYLLHGNEPIFSTSGAWHAGTVLEPIRVFSVWESRLALETSPKVSLSPSTDNSSQNSQGSKGPFRWANWSCLLIVEKSTSPTDYLMYSYT